MMRRMLAGASAGLAAAALALVAEAGEVRFVEKPLTSGIRFDGATTLSAWFLRGREVIRLEATIQR